MKIGLELRVQVFQRSQGRCEYCLIHEADASLSHEVDHIVSRQHGGATVMANLACACWLCNRVKGTNLTSVDNLGSVARLYDPRSDLWGRALPHRSCRNPAAHASGRCNRQTPPV